MAMSRSLAVPLALLLCLPAAAQVDVSLQMSRRQYVAGEKIGAVINVTNHAGRDLVFQGDGRVSWLNFVVKDESGQPITSQANVQFGAVQVPAGQTMSREVDLSTVFRINQLGTYSVYAVVRLPGQRNDGFLSNRVLFNVTSARPFWTQKVGVKGRPGQVREFRVMSYSGDQKTSLYVQVVDERTGQALQTYALGEALLFRKPQATVDGNQILHVLFLTTPSIWAHIRVDVNGSLVGRELHKRGAASDPQLVTFGTGEVQVSGSIPYNPAAEAEARGKVRGISERPPFVYD